MIKYGLSQYRVEGLSWMIRAESQYHYRVFCEENAIIEIGKASFLLGDSYEISIAEGIDVMNALALALIIEVHIGRI